MAIRTASLQNPFQALKNPGYRCFWIGRLLAESAMRIGSVATSWLVYELTGSALALGWVGAGRALATVIVSPWAGVLCDRVEKRRIILICRWATVALTCGIAALAWTGTIQVWHLALSSLLTGIINAFYLPAASSVLPEMVGSGLLMNALSLNAIGLGISAMIFPAISGYMVDSLGVPMALIIHALIYVFSAAVMHLLPHIKVRETDAVSPVKALKDGFHYTLGSAVLTALIVVVIIRFLLSMQYSSLLTIMVSDELEMGARVLGLLLSVSGFGSLVASIALACMNKLQHKGRLLMISVVGVGFLLIAMAFCRWLPALYVVVFLLGAGTNIQRIANQTLLQTESSPEFRGRVMSLYGVCMGFGPVSGIVFGAITDAGGTSLTLVIQGVAILLLSAGIMYFAPRLWRSA